MGVQSFLKPSGKWILPLAIAAGLGTGAIAIYQVTQFRAAETKEPVAPTPLKRDISALGRVEPQGEVITLEGPTGERVGQLLVQEGQTVTQGQPLVYLESYQERQVEKDLAASELAEARASLAAETDLGKAQIQEARSQLGQVRDPKTAEIAAQESTLAGLAAELASAERDLGRFQQLRRQGAVSQKDLDDKALAVRSKQEQLNSAKATLAKLNQEQRTDLQNASDQLQSAQAGFKQSQTQVKLDSAAQNLNLAQARLERTIIRAPQSGQILKVIAKTGEAITEDGILQIGATQQMIVVAEVYEADVGRVQVGQPATITSAALNKPLQGTVAQIGLQIDKNDVLETDPAANTDTRVVEVKIRLEDSKPVSGLTNLQVEVVIQPPASQR